MKKSVILKLGNEGDFMWEQIKNRTPTMILALSFEDFAEITVEKRTNKNATQSFYEVSINVFDITEQGLSFNDFKSLEKILQVAKNEIEDLYNKIPLFDEEAIESWCDAFIDKINDY